MAIQLRRGNSKDLVKSNLLAGEMAISLDTGVPTVGLGSGETVDIVTTKTFSEQINQFGGVPFLQQEETVKGYFDESGNEVETSDGYIFSDFVDVDYATNYYISIPQIYYDDDDDEIDFFPSGYKAAAYDSNNNAIGIVSVIEVVKNRLYIFNSGYSAKKIKICCLSPETAVYNEFASADYVFEQALLNIFNHITDGYDGIITTEKLSDRAVTENKLELGAVTKSILADGCITEAKLSADLKKDLMGSGVYTDGSISIYNATLDASKYSRYTIADDTFPPKDGKIFGIIFDTVSSTRLGATSVTVAKYDTSSSEYERLLKAPCLFSQAEQPALGYHSVLGYGMKYLSAGQLVLCVCHDDDVIICDRTLFSDGYSSVIPLSMLGLTDSGWKTATATSAVTENTYLQYRKVGSQVFIRANIRTTITSGVSSTLFTLPSGYRPTETVIISIPNYNHKACLMIGTDGTAHVEYVTYATGQSAISTVTMSSFSVLINTSFLCD